MRVLFFLLFLTSAPLWARSIGADLGLTGAPGEGTCAACHTGAGLNAGGGSLKVELLNATTYTPGQQHRLRITLADPAARRWGFQLSARRAAAPTQRAGTLASENITILRIDPANNVQYANQTSTGSFPGQAGQAVWELLWTAPAAGEGPVTFFAAGNAANNNLNTAGDNVYTTSLEVAESGAAPPLTSFVLPQFVFGPQAGGNRWTTLIYLHNSTSEPAPFTRHYRADDGTDLNIPGGAQQSSTLAPRETLRLQSPDAASFFSGWVQLGLPAGVSGYAVFRQSVPGRDDNEAVVLLSPANQSAWTLLHDDNGLTTGVALLNPGDSAITIDYTATTEPGQNAGSGTLNLPARSKFVGVLSALPGLSPLAGQRGAVRFTASGGNLAVLGLRFAASAFTSIPAAAVD
jgi:hypothetical protein